MRLNIRLRQVEPNVVQMPEIYTYGRGRQHCRRHRVKGERETLLITMHHPLS